MSETLTPSRQELASMQSRLKKLAEEKAHLQMMNGLMTRLQAVTGLQNTLDTMLRAILDILLPAGMAEAGAGIKRWR